VSKSPRRRISKPGHPLARPAFAFNHTQFRKPSETEIREDERRRRPTRNPSIDIFTGKP
jgi:hypothetical protein